MTQKNNPYIELSKVFITLSRVWLVPCKLSLLNIPCNSLVNHITLKSRVQQGNSRRWCTEQWGNVRSLFGGTVWESIFHGKCAVGISR